MNKIDVALLFNERYSPGAAVAIASVAANANASTALRFHLFTEKVEAGTIGELRLMLSRLHPNGDIVHHVCDEEMLNGLPCWAGSRIAAVRCLYARMLPDVEWCLHLDCDVLCLTGVEELFAHRDEAFGICAVREEDERVNSDEREWICGHVKDGDRPLAINESCYFNSGIMLMNLKKMRQDGSTEKLLAFFAKHPDVPSPDQDALNVVFAGQVKMLPSRYNQSQLTLTDAKLRSRPVIHYVCGNPWIPGLMGVANNRFWLWHACADKWIWQKRGVSASRCFSRTMLVLKVACYWILRSPFGRIFAWTLENTGRIRDAAGWRKSQVGSDISRGCASR